MTFVLNESALIPITNPGVFPTDKIWMTQDVWYQTIAFSILIGVALTVFTGIIAYALILKIKKAKRKEDACQVQP